MTRSEYPPAQRIVFGMVPQSDRLETRARLNDLCGALSRAAGMVVAPHRAPSPESLATALRQERIQIAWVSALLFATSDVVARTTPLLHSIRQGAAAYHSALYTRADSPLRSIDQLRGVKAAWVSPTSASSYLLPRLSLTRRGLSIERAIREEVFLGSHAAVARAVIDRQADIGATYAIFEQGDSRRKLVRAGFLEVDGDVPMHVLDVAGPIPADLIVAAGHVDERTRTTLASAFVRCTERADTATLVRELIGADSFRPFVETDRTMLREWFTKG